jgi:hypothetical protein
VCVDFAISYFRQNRAEAERLFGKAEGPYLAAYSIVMLNTGDVPHHHHHQPFLEHDVQVSDHLVISFIFLMLLVSNKQTCTIRMCRAR